MSNSARDGGTLMHCPKCKALRTCKVVPIRLNSRSQKFWPADKANGDPIHFLMRWRVCETCLNDVALDFGDVDDIALDLFDKEFTDLTVDKKLKIIRNACDFLDDDPIDAFYCAIEGAAHITYEVQDAIVFELMEARKKLREFVQIQEHTVNLEQTVLELTTKLENIKAQIFTMTKLIDSNEG